MLLFLKSVVSKTRTAVDFYNISQDCILEKREKIIAKQYLFFRATHLMSLRGVANGDAVAISRKGILEKRYGGGILYCI